MAISFNNSKHFCIDNGTRAARPLSFLIGGPNGTEIEVIRDFPESVSAVRPVPVGRLAIGVGVGNVDFKFFCVDRGVATGVGVNSSPNAKELRFRTLPAPSLGVGFNSAADDVEVVEEAEVAPFVVEERAIGGIAIAAVVVAVVVLVTDEEDDRLR